MKIDPDKYMSIIVRDGYTCQECGKTPGISGLHLAHRIKKGEGTLKWLKSFPELSGFTNKWIINNIINHPDNLVTVCSLRCNDKQNIFFKPVERDELLLKIINQVVFNKGAA